MTVVFAVHASLRLALVLLLVVALVAAPFALRRPLSRELPGAARCGRPGSCSGCCSGTSRARSAATASSTSPAREAPRARRPPPLDGERVRGRGSPPGYAFPLWQAFLALVAKVAFVDPAKVVLHDEVLAPLAVLVAYEAGYASSGGSRPRPRRPVRPWRSRRWRPVTEARSPRSPCPRTAHASCSSRPHSHSRSRRCATPREGCSRASGWHRSCSPSSTRPTRSSSGSRLAASLADERDPEEDRVGRVDDGEHERDATPTLASSPLVGSRSAANGSERTAGTRSWRDEVAGSASRVNEPPCPAAMAAIPDRCTVGGPRARPDRKTTVSPPGRQARRGERRQQHFPWCRATFDGSTNATLR